MEERELVVRLKDNRTRNKAFAEVVNQYGEQLYWKIRGIVLSHEDADDVLQNTFIKAWGKIDDFHGDARLSTWLYRIAVNESLDFLRKQKGQKQMDADFDQDVASKLMSDDYFDGDYAHAVLQEAIAKLPDVQRTVFTLRYFHEMKYKEISEILGTSEGALKASYHIAVKKITEYVKGKD